MLKFKKNRIGTVNAEKKTLFSLVDTDSKSILNGAFFFFFSQQKNK